MPTPKYWFFTHTNPETGINEYSIYNDDWSFNSHVNEKPVHLTPVSPLTVYRETKGLMNDCKGVDGE